VKTLLRFDLEGRDAPRWQARAAQFVTALRRLVGTPTGGEAAPAIRQQLYRLPPRGVDKLAAQRKSAAGRQLEVAEVIIRRFTAREEERLAQLRARNAGKEKMRSEAPAELGESLRNRRAFFAGTSEDRDLVVDGALLEGLSEGDEPS
jgi:hypothetical protein